MSKFIIAVVLVIVVGFAFISGGVFYKREMGTVKEGRAVSQFTTDEIITYMNTICKGDIEPWTGVNFTENNEVVASVLCGSYVDIKKRFRAEFYNQQIKDIVASCEKFKSVEFFGKEYATKAIWWRFVDYESRKRANISCEIEALDDYESFDDYWSRKRVNIPDEQSNIDIIMDFVRSNKGE